MKWQSTIFVNVLIVFGFWFAGLIAISPAYNYFVQYTETSTSISLPIITYIACSFQLVSVVVPVLWLLVSIIFMMRLKQSSQMNRIELVQLHTSVSIFGGLFLFVFFAVAGVLPFLRFGGLIE